MLPVLGCFGVVPEVPEDKDSIASIFAPFTGGGIRMHLMMSYRFGSDIAPVCMTRIDACKDLKPFSASH